MPQQRADAAGEQLLSGLEAAFRLEVPTQVLPHHRARSIPRIKCRPRQVTP
jgi:hypothetical protein